VKSSEFVNPQIEVSQLAGPEYRVIAFYLCVPDMLELTPYRHVFVTIDSNRISTFVSLHPLVAHNVVMAVLLDVYLFVCLFVCLFVVSRRVSL
jgi:hypothetical protein